MSQNLKITLMLSVLIVISFMPSLVHAQDILDHIKSVLGSAAPGVPDPGGDPDVTVPIDGGLSILAAAGVAYSVKKIKQFRNKKEEGSGEVK